MQYHICVDVFRSLRPLSLPNCVGAGALEVYCGWMGLFELADFHSQSPAAKNTMLPNLPSEMTLCYILFYFAYIAFEHLYT